MAFENIINNIKNNSTMFFVLIVVIIIGCIYYFMNDNDDDSKETIEEFNNEHVENISSSEENTNSEMNNKMNDETNEYINSEKMDVNITPDSDSNVFVYLTIAIEDQFKDNIIGNVIIKLYNNTPITSKNFLELCKNKKYENNKIHRVIKDFMIQMGDITNNDGTGGYSIYGEKFGDEHFENKHYRSGIVSMANSGPNTNGSQFFITTVETPHLDGKHVAFGEVVDGMDTVFNVENQITNTKDEPMQKCFIKDCGIYSTL